MGKSNQEALEFLLQRRSRPAKTLVSPGPDKATLELLLTAAARTPDHGKLEPWRFIVLGKETLTKLSEKVKNVLKLWGLVKIRLQRHEGLMIPDQWL